MVYANGVFVAVGEWNWGYVLISSDGINWSYNSDAASSSNPWRAITYGNGMFVAVGEEGGVMTSLNGINWTVRTGVGASNWRAITYANNQFVAVAGGGAVRVMTSPDGINWTPRTAANDNEWASVTYGNDLFVAGARSGGNPQHIMTSPDGITWTGRTAVPTEDLIYAGGQFVGVFWSRTLISPDGINWTEHVNALPAGTWVRIVYADGVYVVGGMWGAPNDIMTSTDGINWDFADLPTSPRSYAMAYGNGRVVSIVNDHYPETSLVAFCGGAGCLNPDRPPGSLAFNIDHRVLQWCDGTEWQAAGPVDPGGPDTGCSAPDRSTGTIVFNADHCILQYCDGSTWQGIGELNPCACDPDAGEWTVNPASNANVWTALAYGHGMFVAVASAAGNVVMSSPDGVNWTPRSSLIGGLTDIVYADGKFVAISHWVGAGTLVSTDGINWTRHDDPVFAPAFGWEGIAYGNGTFVAVSRHDTPTEAATSSDGVNWVLRDTPGDVRWQDVAYGNGRFVAVGVNWQVSERIMTSDDNGVTWALQESPELLGVTYGGGQFVAVGQWGRIETSPDGITWTTRMSSGPHWHNVAYGGGMYVAVSDSNQVAVSTDGIDWELQTTPENNRWLGIAYGNGRFVAVAEDGATRTMVATCLGGS